ncbi:L-lactate permease [Pseudalkalibacillus hwajinpoensis]|uniref:L-lactate permease n=1 Tax=Guptibacillus hwajinpoensis TaxID=208199 RepID=UPI00325ABD88
MSGKSQRFKLQPLAAVALALIADSSPVSFGAVGTPVIVGVDQGLRQGPAIADQVAASLGDQTMADYLQSVTQSAVIIDLFVGSLIPLIIVMILTKFFGKNHSWREGLALWKFAIFAGFSFTVPAFMVATFLGPEFPSIIGGLVGLGIVVPAAKQGFLLPDQSWDFEESKAADVDLTVRKILPLWIAWLPYLLVAVFLVLTRINAYRLKNGCVL